MDPTTVHVISIDPYVKAFLENNKYTLGLLWGGLKALAIVHQGTPDNRIFTMLRYFAAPLVSIFSKKGKTNEDKTPATNEPGAPK
jgi:hypothetical protein